MQRADAHGRRGIWHDREKRKMKVGKLEYVSGRKFQRTGERQKMGKSEKNEG